MPYRYRHQTALPVLLLCLRSAAVSANADFGFHHWTADNGLPQNIIRGIHQGGEGYLWLATLNGLVRFDGVQFTIFDKSNSPGIRSSRFSSLYGSPNGDLWLSTDGAGITQYHDGVFKTFTTKQGLPNNFVREVIGDSTGNVWALSGDRIAQWDPTPQRFTGSVANLIVVRVK